MKKLYDLNPLVRFEKCANPHVHCNNHVLSALVSGIYYDRKRFPFEELAKINEYICTGKRPEEEQKDDDGSNDPPSGASHEEKQSQAGKPNKNTSRKKQKRQKLRKPRLLSAS